MKTIAKLLGLLTLGLCSGWLTAQSTVVGVVKPYANGSVSATVGTVKTVSTIDGQGNFSVPVQSNSSPLMIFTPIPGSPYSVISLTVFAGPGSTNITTQVNAMITPFGINIGIPSLDGVATDSRGYAIPGTGTGGGGISGQTPGYAVEAATDKTATTSFPLDDEVTLAGYVTLHKNLQVLGSGTANGWLIPEGTAIAGSSGKDAIYTDSLLHRLMQNPNNIGALIIPGVASAITPGHLWAAGTNGIDPVDGGIGGGATLPFPGIVFGTSASTGTVATTEQITAQIPCPLQNATNICITRPPYNADPTGVVDASSSFNAAITALASSGGTIWVPNGTYNLNGPLLDPTGANAILPMPKIANNQPPYVLIQMKGLNKPIWGAPGSGATLQTVATTGNLIGGFDSATGGGIPPFTNVGLNLDNLTFLIPTNPTITVVNGLRLQKIHATNLVIGSQAGTVPVSCPSQTTSVGIIMPSLANNVENYIDDVNVYGLCTGYIIGEHTHVGAGYAGNDVNGFVFDVGFTSAVGSHHNSNSISADYLWCQGCTNVIVSGAEITTVHIAEVDMEGTTGNGVLDPGNLLRGQINYNVTVPFASTDYCNANVSGAAFVTINAMQCQGGISYTSTLAGGFGSAVNFFNVGGSATPNVKISNPSDGAGLFSAPTIGGLLWTIQNTNGCTGCYSGQQVASDAASGNFFGLYSLPASWSASGLLKPLMAYLGADDHNVNGLTLSTQTTAPLVLGTNNLARITINPDGSITYGYTVAPSGACTNSGSWAFSQDGHATFCAAGTWTTKI